MRPVPTGSFYVGEFVGQMRGEALGVVQRRRETGDSRPEAILELPL